MTQRHLAYYAFWFPPSRASGVYRALATVRAFRERGWKVTVFASTIDYLDDVVGSTDESLLDLVPDDVEVVRVPLPYRRPRTTDVRAMSRVRASMPNVVSRLEAKARTSLQWWDLLRGRTAEAHGFQDSYVGWIDPAVNAVVRASAADRGFDLILATGNPFSSFEAARLAAGVLDVPFMIDYRDPWTIDVFTGEPAPVGAGAREVEARLMASASAAIHVNEPIAAAYRQLYPGWSDKQHVVVNGFDDDSVGDRPSTVTGPVRFGVLGTVNDRWPLDEMIRGWELARDELPAGSEFVLAGHLGYFGSSAAAIEDRLPDPSTGFRYAGPIPKREVGSFYESVHVVVVPAPGGSMVTSGKIFEAVAQGMPIVVVQEEGGGARAIVADHPAAVSAEPDPRSVAEAFLSAAQVASTWGRSDIDDARASMRRYQRAVALDTLVDLAERSC